MRDRLHRLVIIVLAVVLLVSGGMVAGQWLRDKRAQEEYDRLAALASQTAQTEETTKAEETETEPETEPYVSPIDLRRSGRRTRIRWAGSRWREPTSTTRL